MWCTKESVPFGDEARGGNWFQMKQEVENGDKERLVLDKEKKIDLTQMHSLRLLPGVSKEKYFSLFA